MAKLYNSAAWLRLQYFTKKKSIEEIANEAGVSHNTIRSALRRNGMLR